MICSAYKLNDQISSGKRNHINSKVTPETHEMGVVTFTSKLNHVYFLSKFQTARAYGTLPIQIINLNFLNHYLLCRLNPNVLP